MGQVFRLGQQLRALGDGAGFAQTAAAQQVAVFEAQHSKGSAITLEDVGAARLGLALDESITRDLPGARRDFSGLVT